METFVLGYLSAVLTLFLIGTVIGIFTLFKLKKNVEQIGFDINESGRNLDIVHDELYRQMEEDKSSNIKLLEDSLRENKEKILSMIDSRIDKLRESLK
jgi:uncharacterized membrane protein